MRVLFPLFLAVALGACLVSSLPAQEAEVKQSQPADLGVINDVDVTVTDLTEEKLNNPPKREIKVERLEEPRKRKLTKPDPKLFEQKYAATFRMTTPANGHNLIYGFSDKGVAALEYIGGIPLLYPRGNPSARSTSSAHGNPSESLGRMVKFLGSSESPAKSELDFFSDPKTMEGMWSISPFQNVERAIPGGWDFFVSGATPEEAETRAKALMALLDQGACRPIQLALLKRRESLCVELRDQRKVTETARQTINSAQEALKSYADFMPDMLSNLRVQQLQLDVELAGVKARVATCERFLAQQPAVKAERRNQIEDLKVTAEIELSGFEARRMKSEEFIGKVKTRIELGSKLSTAEFHLNSSRDAAESLEQQIKKMDARVYAYAPFPLVDNKITIQPLEWTQ